jgi:hypothetical protein
MTTDHDKIVAVECMTETLCSDLKGVKSDVRELRDFMVEVKSMASLGKWQIALTLGNGLLITLLIMVRS